MDTKMLIETMSGNDIDHSKRRALELLLEGGRVKILINNAVADLIRPEHLSGDHFALNLSWQFHNNMELEDAGVWAEPSFAGRAYSCFIPWSAIFGIVEDPEEKPTTGSQHVIHFPGSMPPAILASFMVHVPEDRQNHHIHLEVFPWVSASEEAKAKVQVSKTGVRPVFGVIKGGKS